jgi:hypothetical protein
LNIARSLWRKGIATVVVENGKKNDDYCEVRKLRYQPDGTLAIDGKKGEGNSCAAAASDSPPKKLSKLSCKPKAFAAFLKIPSFDYKCELGQADPGDDLALSNPSRREALRRFEKELASKADPDWWLIPTKELNACEAHGKVGRLTEEEAQDLGLGGTRGDSRLRLITTGDPCLASGNASPSNGFLLVNQNGKTAVTQVIDGFYSRFDEANAFSTARRGSDLFAITNSIGHDATYLYSTNLFYQIDAATGKALPAKIFVNNYGVPSNQLNTSAPMFSDPHKEIIDNPIVKEAFVDKFYRYSYCTGGNDNPDCPLKGKKAIHIKDENSEGGFFATIDHTLSWNGKAYVDDHQDQLKKDYEAKLKDVRECIQSKFDPKNLSEPCYSAELACEADNDLAWLNFKAGNLKEAEEFASKAMVYCENHPLKEQQAARYNQEQIQKALKAK